MIEIPVAFIDPPTGDLGGPPGSINRLEQEAGEAMKRLAELYPGVRFREHHVRSMADVEEFLEEEAGAVGYLVFSLNSIVGLLDPIAMSGKPTVVIAEAYGGAGEALLGVNRPRGSGRAIAVYTRNPVSDWALGRVKHLIALARLRESRVLYIVSPTSKSHITWQFPLSTDLYSVFRSVEAITGASPIVMDAEEFRSKYMDPVGEEEAGAVMKAWIEGAMAVEERDLSEVLNSARLYLAMRRAAEELGAAAVAVDCISLYNSGLLRAWPCLGYMQLWYDGVAPVCEADPYSAIPILIGKYLLGRNGFVVNVGMDEEAGEFIYHHCYAPTNPHGGRPEAGYVITTAHLGSKHASIHVKLPVGEPVTAVGFNPEERELYIHVSNAFINEHRPEACATKLVARGDVRAAAGNWRSRGGWHRVILYGDHSAELEEFAALLGLRVVREA
ncbi:hypothetical protein GCM10007981_10660 [Thermocladium modestius]|uniref:Fucose isomerase n=1 Tax=Thermocladium modestius TaxID=62609 RepID=A0A830GV52_9CREN|nr:fucose isomerase [Thermocladium modestius]GGP20864.1 hypothetical protein GCM10007981_10660 [Thermocladium modestius]